VAEIAAHADSYVDRLPPWNGGDLGVIAGRFDLTVPVSRTHLDGASDHIVLNATHNGLLFSPSAARLAARFLQTGHFSDASRGPVLALGSRRDRFPRPALPR
jgi:hypothetical protein